MLALKTVSKEGLKTILAKHCPRSYDSFLIDFIFGYTHSVVSVKIPGVLFYSFRSQISWGSFIRI